MRITILTLALCAASLLATVRSTSAQESTTASADATEEARMHFDVARRFYDMGHFDEAASEFEAAYEISHLVTLQYNLYLAYRDGGDDGRATSALRLYVESLEEGPRRAQLGARLRILEE
jgi:tetratricopeptide (TPR) repeat protein